MLDADLAWGHAVWCGNLDGDEDQELVIGVRDNMSPTARRGIRIYDPQDGGKSWKRTILDAGGVAVEDLPRRATSTAMAGRRSWPWGGRRGT